MTCSSLTANFAIIIFATMLCFAPVASFVSRSLFMDQKLRCSSICPFFALTLPLMDFLEVLFFPVSSALTEFSIFISRSCSAQTSFNLSFSDSIRYHLFIVIIIFCICPTSQAACKEEGRSDLSLLFHSIFTTATT